MNSKELSEYLYINLLPPLIPKVIRRLRDKYARDKLLRPFDSVPFGLPVEWVLDVGANEGVVTTAALLTYPKCRVISFEPVKLTFETLARNTAPFRERVILHNSALSNQNGVASINITSANGANSLEQHSPFHKHFNPHIHEVGREEIRLVRLDDIAPTFPTKKIDILKIDVEGHELQVLEGGKEFIRSSVDVIIVEISLMRDQLWEQQSIVEIFDLLDDLGFRLINLFDLCRSHDQSMMLIQMDCVFRRKSNLRLTPT